MKQSNGFVQKTLVSVWLTLSIASVVLAALAWLQVSHDLAKARRASAIQGAAEHVLRLMVDCETGQRGFSLTGLTRFLEPFVHAETNLVVELERLRELTEADPIAAKQVLDLKAVVGITLERLHHIVEVRKARGMQSAADIVADGKGIGMMTKIRSLVVEISGRRSDLFSEEGGSARVRVLRASLTSLVAGVLGVGAGLFAFRLSRQALQHQTRERELLEAKRQAERRNAEKSVFLADVSHEIRTPMNAILGFSELLANEISDPKHSQYLHSIRTSAGSLLRLITDMLDMSKIEAGVMELRVEPTDPREICAFLHSMFSEAAAKKGLKLACLVEEDLPRALLLDRMRLRQILINLLGNAVKFTDHGHILVHVDWEEEADSDRVTLIIEVQDTGVGIPGDKLEAIFKPFVQAGTHHEKEKTGTGLGLAIVKRLTELMGGVVTAASVPGQGSAFHLRFPKVEVSSHPPPNEKLEPVKEINFNQFRASTILVADDNEINAKLVGSMLANSHHRLLFAASGEEAVRKAREARPDLILLDIRMPGMNGQEALVEIRKLHELEKTPVIAVTASSLMNEERDVKERFNGYVRKPFSKLELFDEIAHFLPRRARDLTPPSPELAADLAPSAPPQAAPELRAELQRFLREEWPELRNTLAVNECRAFASKLRERGKKWACPFLVAYAEELKHHAEYYAVAEMEKQLDGFPALVERLRSGV